MAEASCTCIWIRFLLDRVPLNEHVDALKSGRFYLYVPQFRIHLDFMYMYVTVGRGYVCWFFLTHYSAWRIQEFQNRGRRLVLMPLHSHVPYVFVVRIENEIHIVNIVCWLWLKKTSVIQSTPPKNFKQGSDCPRSAFAQMNKFVIYVTLKV